MYVILELLSFKVLKQPFMDLKVVTIVSLYIYTTFFEHGKNTEINVNCIIGLIY